MRCFRRKEEGEGISSKVWLVGPAHQGAKLGLLGYCLLERKDYLGTYLLYFTLWDEGDFVSAKASRLLPLGS